MSLIGDAKSEGSILNLDKCEKSEVEVLQITFEIMKQAVASSLESQPGMHGEKVDITIRL